MSNKTKILIAGAGPAGSSLAIRLALSGRSVTLIDKDKFPRHKLCGEFISPEAMEHFQELGVIDEMLSANGDNITETIFYEPNGNSVSIPSKWFRGEGAALSLSRAEMDMRLLERARELGVEIFEETPAIGLISEGSIVKGIKCKEGEFLADIIIDATGRSRILAKKINNDRAANHLIGFKAHLKGVKMEKGRCEIYFFDGGYGGLSHIEKGAANHCFLVKNDIVKEFKGDADRIVEEIIFKNSRAKETMQNASPLFDWLAVSIDKFGIKELNPAKNLYAIGDAAAFIDPFTGSGMLMAMQGAAILANSISNNDLAGFEKSYRAFFARRLWVSSIIRKGAFMPGIAGGVIKALSYSKAARQILARATREHRLMPGRKP